VLADLLGVVVVGGRRERFGRDRECAGRRAAVAEADCGRELGQVGEVVAGEFGLNVAVERVGVVGGELEVDLRAGVGADAIAQVAGELGEVLVREREREPVPARLAIIVGLLRPAIQGAGERIVRILGG